MPDEVMRERDGRRVAEPAPPELSVIGGGRLGRTLARLLLDSGAVTIGGIVNRSVASAREAVAFIGAGRACETLDALPTSEVFLIGAGDAAIETCARALVSSGRIRDGAVVLHCSGALSSAVLESARQAGAHVASLHPIFSFARPTEALSSFQGTGCAFEGDDESRRVLEPLFAAIGADLFTISSDTKALYHAGAVMACNYLVTLFGAGVRLMTAAGVDDGRAHAILGRLASGAVDNCAAEGAARALTGPIARGEGEIVTRHLAALSAFDLELAGLYRALARSTLPLAREQGSASAQALDALERTLETPPDGDQP